MGSVPFGGRYRLIDFPLSNMTNSGIEQVGVVTKSNYRSLMDHIGSGKSWDLSRKRSGLILLPPYGSGNAVYENRLGALSGIKEFLNSCKEEYVFLTDCDAICSLDIQAVVAQHIANAADITMVYTNAQGDEDGDEQILLTVDGQQRVTDLLLKQRGGLRQILCCIQPGKDQSVLTCDATPCCFCGKQQVQQKTQQHHA